MLGLLLALGAAAVLYVIAQSAAKPGAGRGIERYAQGSLRKLAAPQEVRRAPLERFTDASGRQVRIGELPGEIVVVNLWATWCAPCITEMPTLAGLQQAYPGRINVVPISIDAPKDLDRARQFMARHPPLAFYHDPNRATALAVRAQGLPTTLIYDAKGEELARLAGVAEWDSPEARRMFDGLLAP